MMRSSAKKVLLVFCAVIFFASGYILIKQIQEGKVNSASYQELSTFVHTESSENKTQAAKGSSEEISFVPENFNELKKENGDLTGWLTIPDTTVDYPVMFKDNSFYLSHDFNKNSSRYGVPFLEESLGDTNNELVIYGHHMKDGTMFGPLKNYESEDFYKEHCEILWYTPASGVEVYSIIGVLKADAIDDSELFQALLDKKKIYSDSWKKNMQKLSYYGQKIEYTRTDQLMFLITCEYTTENGRMILIAKLNKEERRE